MAARIKLSPKATSDLNLVRQRLNMGSREKLWTLRIAFAVSLQLRSRIDTNVVSNLDEDSQQDVKPFEIDIATVEQKDGLLFRALLNQNYKERLSDEDYQQCFRYHLEHGLRLVREQTEQFSGYGYLGFMASKGLKSASIDGKLNAQTENNVNRFDVGSVQQGVLNLHIGSTAKDQEPYSINFNKTDEHINNYIGIVGKPGSGKTFFAKYLLEEIRKHSNYNINFIIFDYAKGDIASDSDFVAATRAQVIDVAEQPIPLNPFKIEENTDRIKRFAAERVLEIIGSVENIGKVQEQNLYSAIINAYEQVADQEHPYPDFQMVSEELENLTAKADSLTSVFRPLIQHNLFANRNTSTWNSMINQTAIIDIHKLPAMKDLCVFLVLKELYRQIMLLPDSHVDSTTKAREMRTIIVLDEAHHFLGSKKRVQVLEKLIREIRSKGASVMLLSQSPDDYEKADFNFLELLEFVFVLGSNPSSHKFLARAFGIPDEQAKRLVSEVSQLHQGEAITRSIQSGKPVRINLTR